MAKTEKEQAAIPAGDGTPGITPGITMDEEPGAESAGGAPASAVTRRQMLKITAGAVIAAPLLGAGIRAEAGTSTEAISPLAWPRHGAATGSPSNEAAPLFFTTDEFAMVDELTELIIPADDHSPGARAAQVAAYIDRSLAEAWEQKTRDDWRAGLKLIDQSSRQLNGKSFMEATGEQRIAVLRQISQNEYTAEKPEEKFFGELKSWTARGYYTSKIGIHDEMEYKGNTYQKEFSGFEAS
ncbi:MAG TPA: gluconate 2-dehydrogenase subunit 3 family protein [Blastocatellia bacterium]|nr:gluconate 2-dehydrogenase subunit 3 family protein [Blastocatellia bacterium]